MDEKTYEYMKERTKRYDNLNRCKKGLTREAEALDNNANVEVYGAGYLSNYLDREKHKHITSQLASLIRSEIDRIEKEMEEI